MITFTFPAPSIIWKPAICFMSTSLRKNAPTPLSSPRLSSPLRMTTFLVCYVCLLRPQSMGPISVPQRRSPPKGSTLLSPAVHAYDVSSRCKLSSPIPCQTFVGFTFQKLSSFMIIGCTCTDTIKKKRPVIAGIRSNIFRIKCFEA